MVPIYTLLLCKYIVNCVYYTHIEDEKPKIYTIMQWVYIWKIFSPYFVANSTEKKKL